MLLAVYLPANQCHGVLWGDKLITLYPSNRPAQTLFDTHDDLLDALTGCGLEADRQGIINIKQ